jgi:hypothetical protein
MKRKQEYESFDRTMRKLLQIPHSEVKAKLDAVAQVLSVETIYEVKSLES